MSDLKPSQISEQKCSSMDIIKDTMKEHEESKPFYNCNRPYMKVQDSNKNDCDTLEKDGHALPSKEGPSYCTTQLFSKRWHLAYICCLGSIMLTTGQNNLSLAIVCMVNSTSANLTSHIAASSGELNWSKTQQAWTLSAYFYGLILTQIPGGWLAGKYGGKTIAFWGMFISALSAMLLPLCARTSIYLVLASRVTTGMGQGVLWPSFKSMLGHWIPTLESTRLLSVSFSGTRLGKIAAYPLTALLCQYGFDNGWGSVFYITGFVTLVWCLLWYFITADTPAEHPTITKEEKYYIQHYTKKSVAMDYDVPWKSMMTSCPMWASIFGEVCYNWIIYTIMIDMPTFLTEVEQFPIEENGALSALPYLCQYVTGILAGELADFLRSKQYASTVNVRRIFQSLSFLGSGLCLSCVAAAPNRYLVVSLLIVSMSFLGLSTSGIIVSALDFAPRYAGVIHGICGAMGAVTGMVSPVVTGYLTPNGTMQEWQNVFYICGGFCLVGTVTYVFLIRGEPENWALDKSEADEILVNES